MIQIKFKNLEKSEIAREAVEDKINVLVEKFPALKDSKLKVTLEMENSQFQAGPDLFKVKFLVSQGRYDGVIVEKKNSNLYIALADLSDHLLEILNRFGDKQRVKEQTQSRKAALKKSVIAHLDDLRFV